MGLEDTHCFFTHGDPSKRETNYLGEMSASVGRGHKTKDKPMGWCKRDVGRRVRCEN